MPNLSLHRMMITCTSSYQHGLPSEEVKPLAEYIVSLFEKPMYVAVNEFGKTESKNSHLHLLVETKIPVYSQDINKKIKSYYYDHELTETYNKKTCRVQKLDMFYKVYANYLQKEIDCVIIIKQGIDPLKLAQAKAKVCVIKPETKRKALENEICDYISIHHKDEYIGKDRLQEIWLQSKIFQDCLGTSNYHCRAIFYCVLSNYVPYTDEDLKNFLSNIID